MNVKEARKVNPGDKVKAIDSGRSGGVYYGPGDRGRVACKVGLSSFTVALDRGETTGLVNISNWKTLL